MTPFICSCSLTRLLWSLSPPAPSIYLPARLTLLLVPFLSLVPLYISLPQYTTHTLPLIPCAFFVEILYEDLREHQSVWIWLFVCVDVIGSKSQARTHMSGKKPKRCIGQSWPSCEVKHRVVSGKASTCALGEMFYFLFLQEQLKGIIIILSGSTPLTSPGPRSLLLHVKQEHCEWKIAHHHSSVTLNHKP